MKKIVSLVLSCVIAISCLLVNVTALSAGAATIDKISTFNATATSSSSVNLSWTKVSCTQYYLYRYNFGTKNYELYKKLKTNNFTDTKLNQFTGYFYKVKAIKTSNGKTTTSSNIASASCITKLTAPSVSLFTSGSTVSLNWGKNDKATGFQIFRSVNGEDYTFLKAFKGSNVVSYNDTGLNTKNSYFYKVRAFRIYNGKTYYGPYSSIRCSKDSIGQINTAVLKPHRTIKVYNRQAATTTSYTVTLTDRDVNILKNFAAKHFTSKMTREDKLRYTLNWINRNVTYASGNMWNQVWDKTWVDAIFTYKKGQCSHYNGAMAAMMAYLGYDAYVVQSWRGNWNGGYYWQHFWCEVNMGDMIYLMETGNYGEDGDWSYFLTPYSQTSGYIMNCKNYGTQY